MGNLTNYHSHSLYCDGRAGMEDFVRFALSEGFTSYGFSSHAPLPFSTAWTMEWDIMDDYLSEFHRLKEKYAGRIELYIGLEIDYLDETYNASIPYLKRVIRPSPVSGSCRWTTVLVLYIFSTMTKGKWWM